MVIKEVYYFANGEARSIEIAVSEIVAERWPPFRTFYHVILP